MLRSIILRYGPQAVEEYLASECARLYSSFGNPATPVKKSKTATITNNPKQCNETVTPPLRPNKSTQKFGVKTGNGELERKTEGTGKAISEGGLEIFSESRKCKIQENEKIQESLESLEKQETPKKTGVYSKEEQGIAVERKRKELAEVGIEPESLLTETNLRKWISEGKSYQRIARDHVGVHESIVSEKARSFGLRSMVSKYKFFRRIK